MTTPRIGDWMLTASGRQYYPLDPRPEDVHIEDIATALSKQCRFGGHTNVPYSVAEHSYHCSFLVAREHALQALLHDATEAYVVDVPRPLKIALGAVYSGIEQRNWLAICAALGVSCEMHPSVKAADDAMLLAERAQLMPMSGPAWNVPGTAADIAIPAWSWYRARNAFLDRYRELTS